MDSINYCRNVDLAEYPAEIIGKTIEKVPREQIKELQDPNRHLRMDILFKTFVDNFSTHQKLSNNTVAFI